MTNTSPDIPVIATSVIYLLIGMPLLAVGMRKLARDLACRKWPTAEGKIRTSEAREVYSGSSRFYSLQVVYDFRVDGRTYTSDVIYPGQLKSGGDSVSSEAEMTVLRYPNDAAVKVYSNPANPGMAFLEPRIRTGVYWLLAVGLIFLIPVLACWIWSWVYRCQVDISFLILGLLTLFLCMGGGAMFVTGMVNVLRGRQSLKWPQVSGTIVCSMIGSQDREARSAAGLPASSTGLVYEYKVNGRKHYNTRLGYGALTLSNYTQERVFQERYATAQQVKVAYSAKDPRQSVLEPGVHHDFLLIPGIGAVLIAFGLAIWIFLGDFSRPVDLQHQSPSLPAEAPEIKK
jgi:hypothetical protein